MTICVFLLVIAVQTIVCTKTPEHQEKPIPGFDKCKNIKCSAIEDPKCVKIMRKDHNKTMYVIALNKCEMRYMNCHIDYDAKIVPMKQCGHGKIMSKLKNKKMGLTRKKRDATFAQPKRNIKRFYKLNKLASETDNEKEEEMVKLNSGDGRRRPRFHYSDYSQYDDQGGHKVLISRNIAPRRGRKKKRPQRDSGKGGHVIQVEHIYDDEQKLFPLSAHHGSSTNKTTVADFFDQSGYHVEIVDDMYDDNENFLYKRHTKQPPSDFDGYDSEEEDDLPGFEFETEFPLISQETLNSQNKTTEEPSTDTTASDGCPERCSSQPTMVCGKCQHGVYKTFLSECHVKKFTCSYPEEAVAIISRSPCIMSAPFLCDDSMKPIGQAADQTVDKVMQYIKCKFLGRKPNDPRCIN